MAKYLLLDSFNLVFRSFYAIQELRRSDGFPTNIMHGYLRTLWNLMDREKPDHMLAFFDLGSDARNELYPEYKANRGETPEDLELQVPHVKELTNALGVPVIEKAGVEADDLIGAAALKLQAAGHEVYIVSSDKDLAQLIRPGITQLLPPPTANPKLGWRTLDEEGVVKKFGVNPDQIVDYLSLIGDAADNLPGVPGVGPKTAKKWIDEYGSVETIIKKANYVAPARFQNIIPEHAEQLRINLKMIALEEGHEPEPLESHAPDVAKLLEIFEAMEMRKAHADAQKRYSAENLG